MSLQRFVPPALPEIRMPPVEAWRGTSVFVPRWSTKCFSPPRAALVCRRRAPTLFWSACQPIACFGSGRPRLSRSQEACRRIERHALDTQHCEATTPAPRRHWGPVRLLTRRIFIMTELGQTRLPWPRLIDSGPRLCKNVGKFITSQASIGPHRQNVAGVGPMLAELGANSVEFAPQIWWMSAKNWRH